jgi:serine/threonine-protein kinase RIO1
LIAQHVKGLIPQSTLTSLLEKHKREKSAIDNEIRKIKKRMADEDDDTTTEEKIKEILDIIKSVNEANVLKAEVIQRLISKIYIRTRYVNDKSREREIDIAIVYRTYNEIIKGFLTNDE